MVLCLGAPALGIAWLMDFNLDYRAFIFGWFFLFLYWQIGAVYSLALLTSDTSKKNRDIIHPIRMDQDPLKQILAEQSKTLLRADKAIDALDEELLRIKMELTEYNEKLLNVENELISRRRRL